MTKEVCLEVHRFKNFILGLLIVAIVGFLLFMYIDDSRIKHYQDYFLQFNWFISSTRINWYYFGV